MKKLYLFLNSEISADLLKMEYKHSLHGSTIACSDTSCYSSTDEELFIEYRKNLYICQILLLTDKNQSDSRFW